jgi:hypothetical protein
VLAESMIRVGKAVMRSAWSCRDRIELLTDVMDSFLSVAHLCPHKLKNLEWLVVTV